jgi:hypothetical protein
MLAAALPLGTRARTQGTVDLWIAVAGAIGGMASGLVDGPIFLDYNATTPVDPAVSRAALPYLETYFGNPSSSHHYAEAPRAAVVQARAQVAELLGAQPQEIVFTGGGSEADTLAVRGAALAAPTTRRQVITLPTEHPAVLQACRSLQAEGFTITQLPVDGFGRVDPADLQAAITSETALVTVAYGNSETGTLQPIPELATIAQAHGAVFHTDAEQQRSLKLDFTLPDRYRLAAKEFFFAQLAGELPEGQRRPRIVTIRVEFTRLKIFLEWLADRGTPPLAKVGPEIHASAGERTTASARGALRGTHPAAHHREHQTRP